MLTALGGRAWCTGRDSVWSVCQCLVWWVASSYLHLILVCSCETLPPYFQAWVPPWGPLPSLLQGTLRSSFPLRSSLVWVGGHTSFALPHPIRSFFAYPIVFFFVLSYPIPSFFGWHTCFAILSSYPIRSSLPSLAYRA